VDGGQHRTGLAVGGHIVDPHDPAPEGHPERGRGHRGLPPLVDGQVEHRPEERLVGGRQQEGVPESGQPVRGAQQGERLVRGLPEVESGVEHDAIGGEAGRTRPLGPLEEIAGDRPDHVVVHRLGIGDAGTEPDVGGHHRGPGGGGGRQVVGIGEAADVVAHHGAGRVRLPGHRRPPGVDRQGQVETGMEGLDGRDDPVELLGLAHRRAGSRLHTAHIEEIGAVVDQRLRPAHQVVEGEGGPLVIEGVGGAVEDAHHQGPVADVEGEPAEGQGGGGHDRDATARRARQCSAAQNSRVESALR
jgi:hypothetical protein